MAHNNDIPADKREHSTNTSNSKIGHRRTTACNARNCWRKKTNTRRYRGLLARRMTVLRPASSEAPCTQQPTHVVSKVHAQARGTDKKICRRLSACTRASTKSRTRESNAIYAAAYFFMFFVVVVCFRAAISYCKALYMLVLWKIGKSVRPSVCHTC